MGADVKWVTDPERLRPSGSEVFRLLGSNEKSGSSPDGFLKCRSKRA